jgi:hypothetical protein
VEEEAELLTGLGLPMIPRMDADAKLDSAVPTDVFGPSEFASK